MKTKTGTYRVRWYDGERGYGFLDGGELSDVKIGAQNLRDAGKTTLFEDDQVMVTIGEGDRGWFVTELHSVVPYRSELVCVVDEEWRPARVKWFDRKKGYGFVNLFAYPHQDVFLHMETIRGVFKDLDEGEAIAISGIVPNPNGRGMAVTKAAAWEAVDLTGHAAVAAE